MNKIYYDLVNEKITVNLSYAITHYRHFLCVRLVEYYNDTTYKAEVLNRYPKFEHVIQKFMLEASLDQI